MGRGDVRQSVRVGSGGTALGAEGFDAGEVYRVSVRDGAGRDVGAGEFVGTGAAPMLYSLNSSVLRRDATGFSVVDSAGAVVLAGTL